MSKKPKLQSVIDPPAGAIDRAAIYISDVLGSFWFLCGCLFIIAAYLGWNLGVAGLRPFDPAPFNVLDTVLSVFALALTILVLISQKRQRRLEKIREQVEFEINVRAENEITKILEMLHDIQHKMGIVKADVELEEMKKQTDIKEIHQNIQDKHE